MQYKNKELTTLPSNTPYIPVMVRKPIMGNGVFVNKAFHESTTLETKLVDLKDKDGNSLGLTASDEICTPWFQSLVQMPTNTLQYIAVSERTLADIFSMFAKGMAIFNGTMSKPNGQHVHHYDLTGAYTTARIQVDSGVLKITVTLKEYNKSLSAKDFNDTSIRVENPNYDPMDVSTGEEYYYDTEPGANIAAYNAFNSWEPYTGMEESDMAVLPDSVNGRYGKLGEDTYLLAGLKEALKLTDNFYKIYEVYPDTYASMTEVPDKLDTSELTTMSDMFVKFAHPDFPEDASPTQEEYDAEVAKTRAIANITIAPEMDCSHVTNMSNMFGVYAFDEFKIDPDDLFSDIRRIYISYGCSNLTTVPQYDTHNVTDFRGMFACCTSLPKVFPWTIDMTGMTDLALTEGMFNGSSVEEISVKVPDDLVEFIGYSNTETGDTAYIIKNLTPEFLDPNGTLKKINVYKDKDKNFFFVSENPPEGEGWILNPNA